MKKRLVSILLTAVFLMSMMSIIVRPSASSPIQVEAMRAPPELRNAKYDVVVEGSIEFSEHHSYWEEGDFAIWLFLDDYAGAYYLDWFQLRKIGTTAELWVQEDLSWPDPDPHDPDRPYPIILDAQIDYIVEQFETHIWPTDTDYFGMNDFHDGSSAVLDDMVGLSSDYWEEPTGRNVILVSNIRDDNYYTDYPYYIAGFYSGSFEGYFDRNIINIDCYAWEKRVGSEGTEWIPGVYVDRPFVYEGVTAHEWQHLIHADYNPNDPLWMNEACSMFAEVLCGYGADWGAINSYMYTPDNSLTVWGDQGGINILADYGIVQLWSVYLNDHYGTEFLGHFVQAGIPGVEGIETALDYFGFRKDFVDVFHDFRIANLIRRDFPGCGKYNYQAIDITEADPIRTYEISGLPVPWTRASEEFGNTITILGYDTGVSLIGGYGSDYIMLNDWKKIGKIIFNGDDKAQDPQYPPPTWTLLPSGIWHSGAADLLNALLLGSAYVDTGATLEIDTYWDIEDYWDFGFIQVSTDDGETWTSLENEYTTYDHDPSAHPDIIANLPGLTGWSGDWLTIAFDLSGYEGQSVLIGFRYMTDWAFTYEGWYISEARVGGIPIELSAYTPPPPDWEADFMVTAVYAFVTHKCTVYLPVDIWLCDETEWGITIGVPKPSYTILIVSSISEEGFVDYEFSANKLFGRFWNNIGKLK